MDPTLQSAISLRVPALLQSELKAHFAKTPVVIVLSRRGDDMVSRFWSKLLLSHPRQFSSVTIMFLLVSLAFIIRLPSLRSERHPYLFCDEGMFLLDAFRMYESGNLVTQEFRSGSLNSLPITILARLLQPLFGVLTVDGFLTLGRVALTVTLSSLATIFIFLATKKITASNKLALLSALIYVLSPFAMAMSRYWYPDHYIVFFSSIFLWLVADVEFASLTKRKIFFIALTAALALSTKLTFAPIFGAWLLAAAARSLWASKAEMLIVRTVVIKIVSMSLLTLMLFCFINYSIFITPGGFLSGLAFNSNNYQSETLLGSGIIFYSILTLMFVSPFLTALAIPGLFFVKMSNLLLLLSPVAVFIILMGSQGMVVNRNLAVLVPFVVVLTTIGLGALVSRLKTLEAVFPFKLMGAVIGGFLLLNAGLISIAWVDGLKIDSRVLAVAEIRDLQIPGSEIVGVNWSCSGETPAIAAGVKTQVDTLMAEGFPYYIFDTAYSSPVNKWYWGDSSNAYFWNQRFMHFYNMNDRNLLAEILSVGAEKASPMTSPVNGYEVVKVVQGEGPALVVLRKTN